MRLAFHYLALVGCVAACHCGIIFGGDDDDGFGPESACVSCDTNNDFELDPSCTLGGELDVRLGQGADSFSAFTSEEGGKPITHQGPQGGGGHSFIAVQVGDVVPEFYDRVELTLTELSYDDCEDTDDIVDPDDPEDTEGFCAPHEGSSETFVLGGDPPWRLVDGMVEEYGIRMFFEDEGGLQAYVRDPCGREGTARYRWSGY